MITFRMHTFDQTQLGLIKIRPVTPIRDLNWSDQTVDHVENVKTFDLNHLAEQPDESDEFYNICRERMTPMEYLHRYNDIHEVESNYHEYESNTTEYQIYLWMKVKAKYSILPQFATQQAIWDALVYGKLYQMDDLHHDIPLLRKKHLLDDIYPYLTEFAKARASLGQAQTSL